MGRSQRKHKSYLAHLKDIKSQKRNGIGKGTVCCLECDNFRYDYYCNSLKRVPAWREKKRSCSRFKKTS